MFLNRSSFPNFKVVLKSVILNRRKINKAFKNEMKNTPFTYIFKSVYKYFSRYFIN